MSIFTSQWSQERTVLCRDSNCSRISCEVWSTWAVCSETCGGGSSSRSREVRYDVDEWETESNWPVWLWPFDPLTSHQAEGSFRKPKERKGTCANWKFDVFRISFQIAFRFVRRWNCQSRARATVKGMAPRFVSRPSSLQSTFFKGYFESIWNFCYFDDSIFICLHTFLHDNTLMYLLVTLIRKASKTKTTFSSLSEQCLDMRTVRGGSMPERLQVDWLEPVD